MRFGRRLERYVTDEVNREQEQLSIEEQERRRREAEEAQRKADEVMRWLWGELERKYTEGGDVQ